MKKFVILAAILGLVTAGSISFAWQGDRVVETDAILVDPQGNKSILGFEVQELYRDDWGKIVAEVKPTHTELFMATATNSGLEMKSESGIVKIRGASGVLFDRQITPDQIEQLIQLSSGKPAAQAMASQDEAIKQAAMRVKADMRTMAVAIESYYVDTNTYPAYATKGGSIPLIMDEWPFALPTFNRRMGPDGIFSLTTPIAYVTNIYADPFISTEELRLPFAYYSTPKGWILLSPGPDMDWDIDPVKQYDPEDRTKLLLMTYDPTNGVVSGGDIYRVKE